MATSSSDESSTGPKELNFSSSLDSGSRLSLNVHRCQLCNNARKVFYCKDCIAKGDFTYSNNLTERYVDKDLKLRRLKANRKSVEDKCSVYLGRKTQVDELTTKIRQHNDRIRLIKQLIQEKREKNRDNSLKLKEIIAENAFVSGRLPRYAEKVEKLERYVQAKVEEAERQRAHIEEVRLKLKAVTRFQIQQLIEYIFPIRQVQPSKSCTDIEPVEMHTVSALAEATHTAYIRGRWVFTDSSGELHHSIVAPTLPGSGDYSAYNVWVTENKDGVPSGSTSISSVSHNPAYNISAALTHTAQLVNILSFYLDVRLPYKMMFSEFCSGYMNEQQFARKVARLNANILHLCFSQNVNPRLLSPTTTLHNIMQLVNVELSDLGRQGPIETEPELARSLEEQLVRDLATSEDSEEEGDTLPYEWEAVPHVQCPEAQPGSTVPPQQMTNTQQATSLAGGLVTSAAASLASFWKGWTGK